MSGRSVSIGELVDAGVAEIQTGPFGTQLKASDYVTEGTAVINVRNIGLGILRNEKLEYVNEETAERLSDHLLKSRDIVFGRKGAVNRHLYVRDEQEDWIQGPDCIRVRFSTHDVVPQFVSYFLRTDRHQKWILGQAGNKATMASLNHDIIRRISLRLPSTASQEATIEVLAAYDDLIDNNRKRMDLLENAARQLYREWFVCFRFPGHKHTEIIQRLPEKWERSPLNAVCVTGDGIQTGPFGSQLHQSDYTEDGIPVIMPKDLIGFRIAVESTARIPEDLANKLGRHRMAFGDTVYGRRGDIGRRAFIGRRQDGWFCGTGCLRIRPEPRAINPRFLFDTLGSPETAGVILNRAKGSTMLNLNTTVLQSVPVLVPPRRLQELYANQVEPMREMCDVLDEQNRQLRTARDLLLPRLMSGEIAV